MLGGNLPNPWDMFRIEMDGRHDSLLENCGICQVAREMDRCPGIRIWQGRRMIKQQEICAFHITYHVHP